jgi:hypothetical protein
MKTTARAPAQLAEAGRVLARLLRHGWLWSVRLLHPGTGSSAHPGLATQSVIRASCGALPGARRTG